MPLLGSVEYLGQKFVFMQTSFVKGSRQIILVDEVTENVKGLDITFNEAHYRAGGLLDHGRLVSMLDPVRKKQYGSTLLNNQIYKEINEVVRNAKLEGNVQHQLGVDTYEYQKSFVRMKGTSYVELSIVRNELVLRATEVAKLNIKPRLLARKLEDIKTSTARYNTSTFLDASLEQLQRIGFDTEWFEGKEYIAVHSLSDWDTLVIPALIKEYKRWEKEKDFPYFLISIDFESDGLNAFDSTKHPDPSEAVYFSISFADNQSFGVFLNMEHYHNVDLEGIAERMTYLTQRDVIEDRDLRFEHDGEVLEIKRSDLTVIAHNMMIDRRFGMTVGMDIWFDLCTLQLSFNLDPFMTTGINGLKHIVTKFFDIEYAELRDICGPKNMGMFRHLTDKRVIMMYGCADTDLHRLAAKKMIELTKEAKEYYGVDHVEQHMRLDALYNNHKADNDYQGMRVDRQAFVDEYEEKVRILNLYYNFMAQYVGRVKAYNDYEKLVVNAERYNIQLESISPKDIYKAPPYHVKKWTGAELIKAIFTTLNYPIMVWTSQNKKSKLEGKAFKPKPAVNTDALKYYLNYEAPVTTEEIEKSMEEQTSLEDLKVYSTYLDKDYVDPVTGKVLVSKEKFNSYRFPFMSVLLKLSPLVKSVTAELKPIVESGSEYRFAHCNTTSAVTRRDLNPLQTVSRSSKRNYIAYDDDYYFGAVDQAAVEIRILYGLSGNKDLVNPLNNPEKDSHTETAALMHQRPAHTIDKPTRDGIKFLAFGRPYGKEVYSSCKDFYGNTDPDNMAQMAYLFELYDNKLASVIEVLTSVRDQMDVAVRPPQSLKDYLEFDPELEYGRMINEFGYCQHLEIREEEWFRQALRRKAGNFIIQGFAANLLRLIYLRLLKAFWKKGWIQNRKVRVHLTVHDEIDYSYHKTLNPVEFMATVHEALTVKMKGFPTFFVGIGFANNWGEAQSDDAELPVLLVEELSKKLAAGEFEGYDFGDHLEFFKEQKDAYQKRRVYQELMSVNGNKNVWDLERLNEDFENYTVRAMLPGVISKPTIELARGEDDPILRLASTLPNFIASYVLKKDNRKHYLVSKGKVLLITEDLINQQFKTLEDLFNNNPIRTETEEASLESGDGVLEIDVDLDELDFEGDISDMDFDFGDIPLDEDEYEQDGITNLNSGFLNKYTDFALKEDQFVEYGSVEERVRAEMLEAKNQMKTYKNFKVSNGKVILPVSQISQLTELRKFLRGNTTRSGSTVQLYIKHGGSLTDMKTYTEDFMSKLDEFISTKKGAPQ